MDSWEKDWRANKQREAAEQNAAKAARLGRNAILTAAFPEKREALIDKLENFILRWNDEHAKIDPSRHITFAKLDDDHYRLSTRKACLLRFPDGTEDTGFPELEIKFDADHFLVSSSLGHLPGQTVLTLHVTTENAGTVFSDDEHKPVRNGDAVGRLIAAFLPYL